MSLHFSAGIPDYYLFTRLYNYYGLNPLLIPQKNVFPGDIYVDTRKWLPPFQLGQFNDLLLSPIVLPSVTTCMEVGRQFRIYFVPNIVYWSRIY